ncbi:hypothetical protein [Vibrio harveyi]|uniref:hypothetical protein n=1 Tax=Vibrio harveyi TaxID=669 RepID=UPI0002F8E92A|nr:hypothetical protein [Vibrio harveyi]
MSTFKKNTADKRVRITPELEEKILKLANTTKFSEALPALEQAVNMYQMLKDAQEAGSKFYEVDKGGEKYIVRFI